MFFVGKIKKKENIIKADGKWKTIERALIITTRRISDFLSEIKILFSK